MTKGRYLLPFLPLLLAACSPTFGVNVSHVKTNAGFVNSSLAPVGQLYRLETTPGKERVSHVGHIPLANPTVGPRFEHVKFGNMVGAGLTGKLSSDDIAAIKANIELKGYVELSSAQLVQYDGTYTALSSKINRNRNEEAETPVDDDWVQLEEALAEAAVEGSSVRLLMIYGVYNANEAKFGYDNSAVVGGEFKISEPFRGTLEAKITGTSEEAFRGTDVPVLVNYRVIRVSLRPNGTGQTTYHFATDNDFDLTTLPAILRK